MPEKSTSPLITAAYWRTAAAEMKHVRSIAGSGMLAALGSVVKAFYIPIAGPLLRISFTFLPIALSGYLFGPVVAGFAGAVVDILGYMLNPAGGAFHPGFTLNAFLNGFIYGVWLYRRPVKWWRALGACATSVAVVNFMLNPLWLHQLTGEAWLALVWLRVPTNLILLPINTALLFGLLKVVQKVEHRLVQS